MTINVRPLVLVLLALVMGAFVASFPWAEYRGREFIDITRYVYAIEANEFSVVTNLLSPYGILEGYRHEFLWHVTLERLAQLSPDPSWPLYVLSLVSSIVFSYFLLVHVGFWRSALVILNPLAIDLLCSQVRSAFAMAIFLIAILVKPRLLKVILVGASFFVHSSLVVIASIVAIGWTVASANHILTQRQRGAILLGVGAILAVAIAYGSSYVLGAIGDRRATYTAASSSAVYASYWLFLGVLLAFNKTRLDTQLVYFAAVGVTVSTLFFFLSVFNVYGSRFLAMTLPLFMIAVFAIAGKPGLLARSTYPLYLVAQIYFWTR